MSINEFFFDLSERFREAKFGKWKDLAIAVRSQENVKLLCRSFVPKQSKASENFGRSVLKVFFFHFTSNSPS